MQRWTLNFRLAPDNSAALLGLVAAACLLVAPAGWAQVRTSAHAVLPAQAAPTTIAPAQQSAGDVPAPVSKWAQQVTLGRSTVELNGPWKFRKGDNMAWAQADFNDLGWASVDLTPPAGSFDPFLGTSGFMPGWTVLGDAGYSGYAWYRLRVNVQGDSAHGTPNGLEIKMPNDVDDAYQVYVNGQLAGGLGKFTKSGVTPYFSLPQAYLLPRGMDSGNIEIAIRVWMDPATPLTNPDTGGMHGPPVLGAPDAVGSMLRLDWDAVNHSQLSRLAEGAILLLAMTVAIALFLLDRKEKAYLWLALACLTILLQSVMGLINNYTTWIPSGPALLLMDAVLSPALIALWVLFWSQWFRLRQMLRLHRMAWGMSLALAIAIAMQRAPLYGRIIPVHTILALGPITVLLKLMLGAMLVWVTWEGMRKEHASTWLALPAVALVALSLYNQEFLLLHMPLTFFPFGFSVSLTQIAVVVLLNIITILLMRRFLHSLRLREQWELEINQARQIQQLLIPEAIPTIPGFKLESEYRPAQEVGGDFFQILPDGKGGVLVVLGDVTGKGLQAGMQVALIVGAIRTIVETSFEPQYVLESLNRRLCNRSQACATCVAMHVTADGTATIANAGHLAPYLNGKEMTITGNLPLGLSDQLRFEQITIHLQPRDRLLVLTDGVIEAKNDKKELFGFNRTRSISHLPAAFIVRAAEIFGQEDDITVLSISRLAQEKQATGTAKLKAEVA